MSLRLEDVNTKESSLRLSIQTIDYRLGRLEEIAASTHETLTLLRSMMSRQSTPPPSTGAPSVTPSRRSSNAVSVAYSFSRDDASEVDGDSQYRDPSPGPSLLSLRMDSLSAPAPNEEVISESKNVCVSECVCLCVSVCVCACVYACMRMYVSVCFCVIYGVWVCMIYSF